MRYLVLAAGCTAPPPANTTATSTAAPPAVYGANDSGRTVPLGLGENLKICLPENPTTDYSWNATVTDGLLIAESANAPYPQSTSLVGFGGTRSWTVRSIRAGIQQFDAAYVRPGAGGRRVQPDRAGRPSPPRRDGGGRIGPRTRTPRGPAR